MIGPFLAMEAARQKQGQMVPISPRNPTMDVLDTIRNIARFLPDPASTALGVGTGVTKGLTGWFQGRTDRTGVAAAMRDVPGGPSFAPGGSYYDLPQNAYQRPAVSPELAWGGEPGGTGFPSMIPPAFVPTIPGDWPQPTRGPVTPESGGLREPWAWTPRVPWS